MNRYKFRAESNADVVQLVVAFDKAGLATDHLEIDEVAAPGLSLPDVEATFTSDSPADDLRRELSRVVDGHVMCETFALASDFTGERRSGST